MSEVERVLRNWISEAHSGSGQLPHGVDPASWIAGQFSRWWQNEVGRELDAVSASASEVDRCLRAMGMRRDSEITHQTLDACEMLLDGVATLQSLLVNPAPKGSEHI